MEIEDKNDYQGGLKNNEKNRERAVQPSSWLQRQTTNIKDGVRWFVSYAVTKGLPIGSQVVNFSSKLATALGGSSEVASVVLYLSTILGNGAVVQNTGDIETEYQKQREKIGKELGYVSKQSMPTPSSFQKNAKGFSYFLQFLVFACNTAAFVLDMSQEDEEYASKVAGLTGGAVVFTLLNIIPECLQNKREKILTDWFAKEREVGRDEVTDGFRLMAERVQLLRKRNNFLEKRVGVLLRKYKLQDARKLASTCQEQYIKIGSCEELIEKTHVSNIENIEEQINLIEIEIAEQERECITMIEKSIKAGSSTEDFVHDFDQTSSFAL